jgi:hypothetical protein
MVPRPTTPMVVNVRGSGACSLIALDPSRPDR